MRENLCVRFTPPKLMPLGLSGGYGGTGREDKTGGLAGVGWIERKNGMESEAAEVER